MYRLVFVAFGLSLAHAGALAQFYEQRTSAGCIVYSRTATAGTAGGVEWSAPCEAGKPINGVGTLTLLDTEPSRKPGSSGTGLMLDGTMHGRWVARWTDGSTHELTFDRGCNVADVGKTCTPKPASQPPASAQARTDRGPSGQGSTPAPGLASQAGSCDHRSFNRYLDALPAFQVAQLQAIVSRIRSDVASMPERASASMLSESEARQIESAITRYQQAQETALTGYRQNTISGDGSGICSPANLDSTSGSMAVAWVSARIGEAWGTHALNYHRCRMGQPSQAKPIPSFCPYAPLRDRPAANALSTNRAPSAAPAGKGSRETNCRAGKPWLPKGTCQ